jgi:hypothetical protein
MKTKQMDFLAGSKRVCDYEDTSAAKRECPDPDNRPVWDAGIAKQVLWNESNAWKYLKPVPIDSDDEDGELFPRHMHGLLEAKTQAKHYAQQLREHKPDLSYWAMIYLKSNGLGMGPLSIGITDVFVDAGMDKPKLEKDLLVILNACKEVGWLWVLHDFLSRVSKESQHIAYTYSRHMLHAHSSDTKATKKEMEQRLANLVDILRILLAMKEYAAEEGEDVGYYINENIYA